MTCLISGITFTNEAESCLHMCKVFSCFSQLREKTQNMAENTTDITKKPAAPTNTGTLKLKWPKTKNIYELSQLGFRQ